MATDWTTGVRSQAEGEDFSSNLCVQTSSEAQLTLHPMGTGGPFFGVNRSQDVILATHPT
jgi:hypothetical protein